jgi:hypothetical protein
VHPPALVHRTVTPKAHPQGPAPHVARARIAPRRK